MSAREIVIEFARGGNSDAYVREGWQASEAQHRWTAGAASVLALPPLAPARAYALTLESWPLSLPGIVQTLALEINGVPVAGSLALRQGAPLVLSVSGEMLSAERENLFVFRHPHAAAPAAHLPQNRDPRILAFAWKRLECAADDAAPFAKPELLADAPPGALTPAEAAAPFQSLGQNCEFGLFQRCCGIEPHGLLRFADISPERLAKGLRTRFEGIADANLLSFRRPPGDNIDGVHAVYGLYYHTGRRDGQIDLADFRLKEARRLGFLARLLIEELENDEKIFLRRGGFDGDAEALALHRMLRAFHPRARLFVVQEDMSRAGRVERLAPDLYRGYLAKIADPTRVQTTLPFDAWLQVCRALVAHQRALGRLAGPA